MTVGWSTRELAEIAGTTLKTVRHYHRVGLLDEPERAPNGYKRYRIAHLVRLLRIRRLADLGMPLADIAAMEESDEGAEEILRALDAELADSIARQQRIREDLAAILQHRRLAELPPGFAAIAGDLSEADRAFLLLSSRIFDPALMDVLRRQHTTPRSAAGLEFDALTDDSTDEERQSLAERYAPEMRRELQEPRLQEFTDQVVAGTVEPRAWSVLLQGIAELHNAAQIDVLQRANALLGL
ncbi:helix-turn-helix domain-containing protein [Catenuloplanes japonicus]|uniref:helix-turn-helix domain-containing protein n=1 Tax=Catenuloplanes japonicus TaxID=33876 RepID=UPI000527DF6E|nr:MerR family transcriptional regulator [Catenuloplanes japonicus]